jgi:hypothetical protein
LKFLQCVQVCDATVDATSNTAGFKKIISIFT